MKVATEIGPAALMESPRRSPSDLRDAGDDAEAEAAALFHTLGVVESRRGVAGFVEAAIAVRLAIVLAVSVAAISISLRLK